MHAPLKNNNTALNEKSKDELIWNYDLNPVWQGKQFMHGHAVVDKPTNTNNGVNINTGCGLGGYLTGTLIMLEWLYPHKPTLRRQKIICFSISETGALQQIPDDNP